MSDYYQKMYDAVTACGLNEYSMPFRFEAHVDTINKAMGGHNMTSTQAFNCFHGAVTRLKQRKCPECGHLVDRSFGGRVWHASCNTCNGHYPTEIKNDAESDNMSIGEFQESIDIMVKNNGRPISKPLPEKLPMMPLSDEEMNRIHANIRKAIK